MLLIAHSEWHEFICFSLQLLCTFGVTCTTWSECFQIKWSWIFAPCSAFVEQVCFALPGKAAVSEYWMTPSAFSFLLWLDHVVQVSHIQGSSDVFCVSCQLWLNPDPSLLYSSYVSASFQDWAGFCKQHSAACFSYVSGKYIISFCCVQYHWHTAITAGLLKECQNPHLFSKWIYFL